MNMRVYLAGEGANEIGHLAKLPAAPSAEGRGVLQALLARVEAEGWEVLGTRRWKDIRKLSVGRAGHADVRNVVGAALHAKEAGARVLVFSRDCDSDPERRAAIEDGVSRVPARIHDAPQIVGAAAVPALEGWILALAGVPGTEKMSRRRAEAECEKRQIEAKNTAAMVGIVDQADLARIPSDAVGLRLWLDRAKNVLCNVVHGESQPPS